MEAVNCASFRVLCKRRGASLVYTDMIDADIFAEFLQNNSKEKAIARFINPQKEEYPLAIQIAGANLDNLRATVQVIQPLATTIDYNIGCPLGYMCGKKAGAYLMKHPDQLYKIIRELREMIAQPFSVKMRSGWDKDSINALQVAIELESLGVDAIAIHPRTRKQKYQDRSDWNLVREIKAHIDIPVILSGDVTNAYMAHMAFAHTKCDYIMIARGAKNNPSIFKELHEYWKTKEQPQKPAVQFLKDEIDAKKDFFEFLRLYNKVEQRNNLSEIKDHARWTARGCKANIVVTREIEGANDVQKISDIINAIRF